MFSNYLPYFQPVSEHTSLPGWKHGGETQHQINSQISTGHDVSTTKTIPANTSKAGEGHYSQHQQSYGRFSHFHRCKTRELLGYYSFSNIFIHEIFYLQKSDSQCSSTDGQPYQSFPGRQQPTGKSKGQRQI